MSVACNRLRSWAGDWFGAGASGDGSFPTWGATRAVLAVPVAVDAFATAVAEDYDEIVCLERVAGNLDLGDWYATLDPVEDDEVIAPVLGQR